MGKGNFSRFFSGWRGWLYTGLPWITWKFCNNVTNNFKIKKVLPGHCLCCHFFTSLCLSRIKEEDQLSLLTLNGPVFLRVLLEQKVLLGLLVLLVHRLVHKLDVLKYIFYNNWEIFCTDWWTVMVEESTDHRNDTMMLRFVFLFLSGMVL